MKTLQFTIPQQYMVGEIKIDTKAQLRRQYTRLLIEAFVPYQEAMLAYLDELMDKHDPKLVEKQLAEIKKQNSKKSKEWEQTFPLLHQTDQSEREKMVGRLLDIQNEENALRQTHMELLEKLDIETRSHATLENKRKAIIQLLTVRQEMIEEGTWEKIGEKEKNSMVFSLLGDDSLGFQFSKKQLKASAINDIYDWMNHYHPESMPPGEPFPAPLALKKAPGTDKKEVPPQPVTEFQNVPDEVTANIRKFLAIRRPGYTLLSLLDRSQDGKRAWLALLTRKLHDETVEQISDVIIELEPNTYMTIQNVRDPPAIQPSPDPHLPS
jgi:hypothetical protein